LVVSQACPEFIEGNHNVSRGGKEEGGGMKIIWSYPPFLNTSLAQDIDDLSYCFRDFFFFFRCPVL
jgi:hypothetical protein